jgi:hypothetical protein
VQPQEQVPVVVAEHQGVAFILKYRVSQLISLCQLPKHLRKSEQHPLAACNVPTSMRGLTSYRGTMIPYIATYIRVQIMFLHI